MGQTDIGGFLTDNPTLGSFEVVLSGRLLVWPSILEKMFYNCFIFALHLFYICFTFVLHLFYICFTFVLHLFTFVLHLLYICFTFVLHLFYIFIFSRVSMVEIATDFCISM